MTTHLTASALRLVLGGKPKRARSRHLEDTFQECVVDLAKMMLRKEVVFWHTPNGGKRNVREAARLKRMGTKRGIPDLFFLRAGALYGIELKVEKNNTTDAQDATIAALTEAGAQIAVCRDMGEVIAAWRKWNLCAR